MADEQADALVRASSREPKSPAVAAPRSDADVPADVSVQPSGRERAVLPAPREAKWPTEIKIGERHRKEFGDLEALARSINERGGLIHPISVTSTLELIAGERRLRAWQLPICQFREQPIPITEINIDSIIAGEHDENDPALRKNFTPSEAVAIARTLRPRLEAAAKERQREGGRSKASGNLPEASKGETREQVAKATGKGARTLEKAEAIVAAAEAEPDKYSKLVEDADRTGNVNGPYKRLRNMQAAAKIVAEPPGLPMNGPYRTGIIDVPWASEPGAADKDHGARGYYPYPTMTPEQVAAMPVPGILHAHAASVWLWITNFHLMHGHHLIIAEAWGLKPVALFTWVKSKFGQGQRARGATEHVVQMIRGDVACLGGNTKTWFEGKGGAHSQKPVEFYDIVEKLTPAPRYFELFSRGQPRDRWDLHGDEVGKLNAAALKRPRTVAQVIEMYITKQRPKSGIKRTLTQKISPVMGRRPVSRLRASVIATVRPRRGWRSQTAKRQLRDAWIQLCNWADENGFVEKSSSTVRSRKIRR